MTTENDRLKETEMTETRSNKFRGSIGLLVAFASVLAMITGTLFALLSGSPRTGSPAQGLFAAAELVPELVIKVEKSEAAIVNTSATVESLKQQLSAISRIPDEAKVAAKLTELGTRLDRIEANWKVVEQGLLDNPEKAMAVPLLRKDIESLQAAALDNVTDTERELGRLYSLGQWFLGLMFANALGILGLVWQVLKEKSAPSQSHPAKSP